MTTKRSGGQITGLLALTVEAQEAISHNTPVMVTGDYEVHKADGTKPVLGYASVVNVGRAASATSYAVGVAKVPGDITVEARGLMVRELVAGAPVEAGSEVAVGSDSKHYEFASGGTPTNEAQTITEGGSGLTSYVLHLNGHDSGSIAAGATATAVQTAIAAITGVGTGNVRVSGSASGPYTVTFVGDLSGEDVPQMTATPTGGSGTVTIATATAGAGTTLAPVGIALTSAETAGDLIDVLVR